VFPDARGSLQLMQPLAAIINYFKNVSRPQPRTEQKEHRAEEIIIKERGHKLGGQLEGAR
jgi:hypothetical protein